MKLYLEHDYYIYDNGDMIYKGTFTDEERTFKNIEEARKYAEGHKKDIYNGNDYILIYKYEICDDNDIIEERWWK